MDIKGAAVVLQGKHTWHSLFINPACAPAGLCGQEESQACRVWFEGVAGCSHLFSLTSLTQWPERAMETPRVCGVLPLINQSMLRSNAAPPTKSCGAVKNFCQLLGNWHLLATFILQLHFSLFIRWLVMRCLNCLL